MKPDEMLSRLAPPRIGPFKQDAFGSPLHSTRNAAWLGLALGISFTVCFATGLLSHLIQHPPGWFSWPPRPAWLYRATQGVHVATGIASIPLLLAKLWTVYPSLWTWPPMRGLAHALERVSLVPLVGGALFLLFSGVGTISRWFPWGFSFPAGHYSAAWITMGGLVVHIGAKIGATRLALSRRSPEVRPEAVAAQAGLTRRGFLATVAATTTGLVAITVGQTLRPLASLGLLAPRDPRIGPQGLPVNKTAATANVVEAAMDPEYRLRVEGPENLALSLEDLRAMPARTAHLTIACVEGWSASAEWTGVPLRDVIALAGGGPSSTCRVESLQDQRRPYSSSEVSAEQLADADTLLAFELNGEALHIDHGFPVRLIGPGRPGVQQTKWVSRVVVS